MRFADVRWGWHEGVGASVAVVAGAAAVWATARDGAGLGSTVAIAIAALLAAVSCSLAAHQIPQTRRTWRLLTLACLVWFGLTIVSRATSVELLFNLGSLSFIAIAARALSILADARRVPAVRREGVIEALLTGLATTVVGYEFLLKPLNHPGSTFQSSGASTLDIILQCGAIGLALLLIVPVALGSVMLRVRVLISLLGGVLAPAAGLALAASRSPNATFEPGVIRDFGWLVGLTLVAIAARLVRDEPARESSEASPGVGAYLRRTGGVACICALVVTASAVESSLQPGVDWVIAIAAAATGVLIAAQLIQAGSVTERLLQRTRERDRLAMILNLSPKIVGTLDVDRVLPTLASAAARAIDRTRAEVTVLTADGTIGARASYGLTDDQSATLAASATELLADLPTWLHEPVVRSIDRPTLPPATREVYREIGKSLVLIAPLFANGQVAGVIEIWTPHCVEPFTADDINAAMTIGREGGLAIHNAHLMADALTSADERAMLLRVTQAATSSLEWQTVLAEIAQASLGIAGTECCTILLADFAAGEMIIGADQTVPDWPGVEPPGRRIALDPDGSDMIAITARQPRRFDRTSPELPQSERDHMVGHGTESLLVVPLIAGETCLGTLNLMSRKAGVFDDNAARLGIEIASQTALAIKHARLLDETRHHAEEQSTLFRVGKAATSSLELRQVLEEIVHASLEIPGAECCTVLLWDREAGDLELGFEATIPDWPGVDPPGTRYSLDGEDVFRSMLGSREPRLFRIDDDGLSEDYRIAMVGWGAGAILHIPLWVGDECLGIFQVYARQPHAFSPVSLRLGQDVAAQTALAIHNAQLLAESRQRAEEQEILLRVTRAATSSLDMPAVLTEIAAATMNIPGVECCSILTWDADANTLVMGIEVTVPDWPGVEASGERYRLQPGDEHSQILGGREAVVFHQQPNAESRTLAARMVEWGAATAALFPLWVGDECLGLLTIYSRRANAFGEKQLRLGRDVSAQTALAMHNALLLRASRQHAEELAARLRVSQAVSSSLDLEEVLGEVARASLGVAGAECCEIELWHRDEDETELITQQNVHDWPTSKVNVGARLPLDDWPLSRRLLTTGQVRLIDANDSTLTEHERAGLFKDETKSGVAFPIMVEERCLGMLSLYSRQRHAFGTRAVAIGQDLASQAALAIERAHLHSALESRARTDALTGVLNRGAIEEELGRELTRAQRAEQPLAVLVIDLDGFKHVNDHYGHLAGDRVLQETAKLLRLGVRDGDLIGRYGGDEFLAVLPNADGVGALAATQRILAAVSAARVTIDDQGTWLPVRLSIGCAVYPEDGATHEELIDAADQAMYAVKSAPTRDATDIPTITDFATATASRSALVPLSAYR